MLRVTRLTDYATVVLTVLAARPDAVLSAPELAERSGLEPPTVAKVLKPLAAAGLLNPVLAGAAMALSSVSVVSNALLLGYWKPDQQ